MTSTTLLEPSFADLIAAMQRAGDIAEDRRRHWTCSIRQLAAGALERNPISSRPTASRPARRYCKDSGQSQGQRQSGATLVQQGKRLTAAWRKIAARVDDAISGD